MLTGLKDGYRYIGRATKPGMLACLDYEEVLRDEATGEEYASPKEKLTPDELVRWKELSAAPMQEILNMYLEMGGKSIAQANAGSMAYFIVKFGNKKVESLFDSPKMESLFEETAQEFESLF